jgi:indole-3-glycerol phosphate synthase
MQNILEEIYQNKLVEVRNRKKKLPLQEICARIKYQEKYLQKEQEKAAGAENKSYKNKNFFTALQHKNNKGEIALICEVKKASPSHGIIRPDFDHIQIAKDYEKGGAACISVVTDEKYFMGKSQYLQEISAVSSLPLLCKDFMTDIYQIYEAKMLGAACILLIVAMLDDNKLQELEQCALEAGLSVLIEVHNEAELQRASRLKSKLLGINNRDLKTLQVDLQTSLLLAEQISDDYVLISESGIKDALDIDLLRQAGINCFLIGEHFMAQKNIVKALKDIFDK